MGDLMKRQFSILDLSGKKFLEWKVDAMMNLKAQGLEHTVKENKSPSGQTTDTTTSAMTVAKPVTEQDKAKALVLLRHHLHEGLKTEYMMVEDPKELWDCLIERFGHHKRVLLPKALFDWTNLRFQDFKSVIDYNSTIHEIVSILRYCDHPVSDEHMIEKTLTTFHASNILLQEQYRERGFKKFNELMSVLLVAEQNSELLLKNHNLRPTGSLATHHEANATNSYPPESNATRRGGRGNYNGRGKGRGNYRGRGRGRGRNNFQRNSNFKNFEKQKGQSSGSHKQTLSKGKDTCYRCGMTGHWGRTCRTAKHLVDLYQASVKGKEKNAEANYVNEENAPCPTLDVSDFFMDNAETGNDFILGENNNA
ncbi:uncharacterized protein LOC110709048 [Chenopodium quinoa]|uniref:uncharacterized protein LOC110709048 n=1 Tax=Chenopodium quinoa TaxID=63459 RepID=UPI000B79626A|nr:uncharacterized protein LOC110709048 [Chenopodium quinoa]